MTKPGTDRERLVALIEASLDPEARVTRNEKLPVLTSRSGKTRECDVVIRTGPKHREMITILEVQDRGQRVDINDFGGWTKKREEVGAQRLICVSRHDFPESIKEKAEQAGQSVILITIKGPPPESLPSDFLRFEYRYCDFRVTSLDRLQASMSRSEVEAAGVLEAVGGKKSIKANDPRWLVGGCGPVTLSVLCRDFYARPPGVAGGHGVIEFEMDATPSLQLLIGSIPMKVGIKCEFQWTEEITRKPVSVLTYEQDAAGVLVWVAEVRHETPHGPLLLRAPCVQEGDEYILRSVYAELPADVGLTMVGYRRSKK
ncbi:MAG: hypothetical protein GY778_13565 [bacterium]|nr:hypothetical protein [bacterium]